MQIQSFLTSYDPSDLPGGSVDPLGFDRGYQWLAEKILPGLTNVADQPRYFSALCAGLRLADSAPGVNALSPRDRIRQRREVVARLERFWVLASLRASEGTLTTAGIRGIRYVRAADERIRERGERQTDASYRLLSRQTAYGMLGIYSNIASRLRLLDDDILAPTADLGMRLGEAFLEETDLPAALRQAVIGGGSVSLEVLTAWGARAHLSAAPRAKERRALGEALAAHDTRRRMVALLAAYAPLDEEGELSRIQRIHDALVASDEHPDLREALRVIVAYENAFRESLLVFQRLLWPCQAGPEFHLSLKDVVKDQSLAGSQKRLALASAALDAALDAARTPAFLVGRDRITDVQQLLRTLAHAGSAGELALGVVRRHGDVQRAKLFAGRPKMPWIELREDRIVPTLAAAQRIDQPPLLAHDLPAHPYRTWAADRLARAGGLA
jgi:hypothetical protein